MENDECLARACVQRIWFVELAVFAQGTIISRITIMELQVVSGARTSSLDAKMSLVHIQ
jgi:hypothetical protein